MATSTGIIMLVYLREAITKAGGLENMSSGELRAAVLAGAVQRLRPKLLTEGTVVLGLAPMLWTGGIASEIIRPMAAPVLGGILVADEVIDLFLPVLFYWVRRRRWKRLHTERTIIVTEAEVELLREGMILDFGRHWFAPDKDLVISETHPCALGPPSWRL